MAFSGTTIASALRPSIGPMATAPQPQLDAGSVLSLAQTPAARRIGILGGARGPAGMGVATLDPALSPLRSGIRSADPDTFTDPQGRVFKRKQDAPAGHTVWEHKPPDQSDAAGNRLKASIVIDVAPDGTSTRTEMQRLDLVSGEYQEVRVATKFDAQDNLIGRVTDTARKQIKDGVTSIEKSHAVASFDAQGMQTAEVTDTVVSEQSEAGKREQVARITATIAGDQIVKQHMDMTATETAEDPATGDRAKAVTKVDAVWDAGGAPITDQTVPVIKRTADVEYSSPHGGLHKGYPRRILTHQTAEGPVDRLKHSPLELTVRFEGKNGQYLERVLSVPVNAAGEPDMNQARQVKVVDKQHPVDKTLMHARIWGGFASNAAIIAGSFLIGTPLGAVGKALTGFGMVATLGEVTGEVHALATDRSDASVARLSMSLYDATWNALYGILVLGRSRGGRMSTRGMPTGAVTPAVVAAGTFGGAGLAGHLLTVPGADRAENSDSMLRPKVQLGRIGAQTGAGKEATELARMAGLGSGPSTTLAKDLASVRQLGTSSLRPTMDAGTLALPAR